MTTVTTPAQSEPAVDARDVGCRFGSRWALRGVSLQVPRGEILGLLGPNGAGKTTFIDTVCGLLRPTNGTVRVFGVDVSRRTREGKRLIGLLPQETALYDELDAVANLRFAAGLYDVAAADRRIAELLDVVGLADRSRDRVGTLSGGMKRRLAIARAMVHSPELLVLDEPTLGVDVEARHAIWRHIRGLRALGHTVLLTTNYLDEAEALCDRVAILKQGELVTIDSPRQLVERIGRCVDVDCDPTAASALAGALRARPDVAAVEAHPGGLTVFVGGGDAAASAVATNVADRDDVLRTRVRAPALAEIFELLTTTA